MRREQPFSVLLQENPSTMMIQEPDKVSHTTAGLRKQYETAEQVVSQYQNLNFMPQKNEGRDKLEVLK